MTDPTAVRVDLAERSYDILVGRGLLAEADRHLAPHLRQKRVVIVSDEAVAAHHLPPLQAALDRGGIRHDALMVPPGEASKSRERLFRLLDDMLDLKVDRDTTVLALGGGVTGDLAGFAASIVLRGLDFIQAPTTLLAQVDSSVGGKTGINTRHGKNLVGSFHQPRLVLADTGVLDTLPDRDTRSGYAEIVKYGLIDDPDFFAWLEDNGQRVLAREPEALAHAVATSCRAKARVVGADERESGQRALLNLGHTFAHALEAEAGYQGDLLHGEAVAIGMVMAFDLSVRLGLCPDADAARLRRHLSAVGLPVAPPLSDEPPAARAGTLLGRMASDKKVRAGKVRFVLARGIGRSYLAEDVAPDAVRALLDESLAAA